MNLLMIGALLMTSNPDYREVTRRSYDKSAEKYRANTAKLQPEVKAQAFLSYLSEGAKILDLGCGPGRDAKFFSDNGYKVVGVDISPKMIEMAKDAVPEAEFIVSDIESLSLHPESFDAVWASSSLLHVSKKAMPDVLGKIYMSLKPEGVFYISMKKGEGEEVAPDDRYGGVEKFWNYVGEEELEGQLTAAGFQILEKDLHKISTVYQTHPWISMICQKPATR